MTSTLIPKLALLLHSQPHQPGQGPLVLSLHEIISRGDQPMLDSGRLLSHDEAQEIANVIRHPVLPEESAGIAFLSPFLIRQTPASLTWYRPPSSATMHWRTKERTAITAVLPGLLFHVRDRTLYVAAFDGASRPTEQTPLYHAPVGNVYSGTSVCVGNAVLPATMLPSDMPAWEHVLLSTNFTHTNHAKVLRAKTTTEQLVAFWTRRTRLKSAPGKKLLAPLGVTAGQWVSRLEGRQ